MFIMTAENAVRLFSSNERLQESKFLRRSILDGREHQIENYDVKLSHTDLANATEYARDVCGIDFTQEQIQNILELYPAERINVAIYSLEDTMTRESFSELLAHFLVGSHWPTFGDDTDMSEFQALLELQAQKLGYKLTLPST